MTPWTKINFEDIFLFSNSSIYKKFQTFDSNRIFWCRSLIWGYFDLFFLPERFHSFEPWKINENCLENNFRWWIQFSHLLRTMISWIFMIEWNLSSNDNWLIRVNAKVKFYWIEVISAKFILMTDHYKQVEKCEETLIGGWRQWAAGSNVNYSSI